MPRKRTVKMNRDGISVDDRWAERGHQRGMRWRFKVWDPKMRTYIRKSFSDDQEAEGKAWAKLTAAQVETGVKRAGAVSVAAIAADYVQQLNDQGLNAAHVREVKRVLSDLVKSGVSDMKAEGFKGQVSRWFRTLKAREKSDPDKKGYERVRRTDVFELSPVTKNRYLGHVRALVQYAVAEDLLTKDPLMSLKGIDEGDSIKATFSVPEIRQLIALQDRKNPAWLWAVVMAYTGMRSNEAMHLRWEWIDFGARRVSVLVHPDYNLKRGKERTLVLQKGLAAILNHPKRPDLGWVIDDKRFRTANNKCTWADLCEVLKDAQIVPGARTPHSFRHTFAALKVATREDVFTTCREMGHSDLKMTDHYSREAAGYRMLIDEEGWGPGELHLTAPPEKESPRATAPGAMPGR